jgi:glucose-6-phosphate dehydrogenase assembly protein OpcA
MGIVAEIERSLARQREHDQADGLSELRTSTMTHLVWAPPRWLERAQRTLAGLVEQHPARTIFLVPEPGRRDEVEATASRLEFTVAGAAHEVVAEVVEIRLRGTPRKHPASVVLPLLRSDLPVFCRWRGEPAFGASELDELVELCDRLVVDSNEWRRIPAAYGELCGLFEQAAVSDIAFSRSLPWRARLAEHWPGIAGIERLRVEGPRADSLLVAGWLRSRLDRHVTLTRRDAPTIRTIAVDGQQIAEPFGQAATGSELLSAELDVFSRDRIYEAAVHAAL